MTKQQKAILISGFLFVTAVGYLTYWHTHAQTSVGYVTGTTTQPTVGSSCVPQQVMDYTPTSGNLTPIFYACGNNGTLYGPYNQAPYVGYNWTVVAGLFSLNTMLGAVYYYPQGATIYSVAVRTSGSLVCTAAPMVSIRDLGTSVSTSFASSTQLTSQATSTSAGAFSTNSLSVSISSGHWVGFALTAGTCVTPPQIDATITVQ